MIYKKFDLSVYKTTTIYFKLFDVIIKNNQYNKDLFLESKKITPSSYRRSSKSEQKIGITIIKLLSETFDLEIVDYKKIDELELFFNKVYYDIYYKISDNYETYIKDINMLLSKNLIIYPILNLFKLFILANMNNSPKDTIKKYNKLYEETISFLPFYESVFGDVSDAVRLAYSLNLTDEMISKKYNLGLHYFIIGSKLWTLKNYTGSLYYCLKAKQLFFEEENYIRIIYVNFTIMSNYNMLANYEECNVLAYKQLITLKSSKNNGIEYKTTKKHLMFSLLGLKKYDEVLKLLENNEGYNITDMCCLLICKYKENYDEYNKYFTNEILLKNINENYKTLFENLHLFLTKNEKKALVELEKCNVGDVLIKILKKL